MHTSPRRGFGRGDVSCRAEPVKDRSMSVVAGFPRRERGGVDLSPLPVRPLSAGRVICQPADRRARGIPLPWTAVSRFVHLVCRPWPPLSLGRTPDRRAVAL